MVAEKRLPDVYVAVKEMLNGIFGPECREITVESLEHVNNRGSVTSVEPRFAFGNCSVKIKDFAEKFRLERKEKGRVVNKLKSIQSEKESFDLDDMTLALVKYKVYVAKEKKWGAPK